MNTRTISAAWVKGIADMLQELKLDASALFAEAGLDIDELNNPEARFMPEKVSVLWELATQRSGNPAIALTSSRNGKPSSFDAIAYVMMSCPNLLAAIEHLIRFLAIVSDAAEIHLQEQADGYGLTVELWGAGRPVPRQRIEFVLVTILNFCRWITGRELQLLVVDLAQPAPDDLQPYSDAFRCPLQFNAPLYRLLFSRADLLAPLPTSNPMLAEVHTRYASEHMKRLGDAKTSYKAREIIIRNLAGGEPLRADVAKELCMSERTLQRRLQEEGTSFQDLIDATRKELAEQYLAQKHLTLTQTIALLGFANQSTFFRCCKRWFGMSPGEYRIHLEKNGSPQK